MPYSLTFPAAIFNLVSLQGIALVTREGAVDLQDFEALGYLCRVHESHCTGDGGVGPDVPSPYRDGRWDNF